MKILAFESSCDETAAAVVADGRQVLADEIFSQVALHEIYGGVAWARERALTFITLEVRAGNGPAIALYEKHGFARVGLRKNYYEKPREDAILMTLVL